MRRDLESGAGPCEALEATVKILAFTPNKQGATAGF